jgi:hypothetical protein
MTQIKKVRTSVERVPNGDKKGQNNAPIAT